MAESPPTDKHCEQQPTWLTLWIARAEWTFIAFMLYALSLGPMYWTWFYGKYGSGGSSWIVAVFYEPLWQLARWFPPVGHWLDAYLYWWILG